MDEATERVLREEESAKARFSERYESLRSMVEQAINNVSAENGSNTPDFILAEYLLDCLAAFDKASRARERWYGRVDKPCSTPEEPVFELYIGDIVRHKKTRMVGKVTGFAHDGSDNVMVDHTGPYTQESFERLVPG